MKETILDVLMYLFDNYEESETLPPANRDTLRVELTGAGFPDAEVERAFDWLSRLAEPQSRAGTRTALRIFAPAEMQRLDTASRGMLMELQHVGVLDTESRELVIDLLMSAQEPVDARFVKWACLLVVLNRETPPQHEPMNENVDYAAELQALFEERQRLQ